MQTIIFHIFMSICSPHFKEFITQILWKLHNFPKSSIGVKDELVLADDEKMAVINQNTGIVPFYPYLYNLYGFYIKFCLYYKEQLVSVINQWICLWDKWNEYTKYKVSGIPHRVSGIPHTLPKCGYHGRCR